MNRREQPGSARALCFVGAEGMQPERTRLRSEVSTLTRDIINVTSWRPLLPSVRFPSSLISSCDAHRVFPPRSTPPFLPRRHPILRTLLPPSPSPLDVAQDTLCVALHAVKQLALPPDRQRVQTGASHFRAVRRAPHGARRQGHREGCGGLVWADRGDRSC